MTEIVVRTSKLTPLADVASAYSLAYVAELYLRIQAFLPPTLDVGASQGIALALLGGIFTSLLIIVDPVNKIVNKLLPSLLRSKNAILKPWASELASKLVPKRYSPTPGTENEFYLGRARHSYWTPYMSKWRTQLSGGVILSLFLFGFVPHALALLDIGITFAILAVGMIVLYSISRDLRNKIPGYCWIIAVYGLMIQFMPREERDSLDRIAKHLSDANWSEAIWWMGQTLRDYPPMQTA